MLILIELITEHADATVTRDLINFANVDAIDETCIKFHDHVAKVLLPGAFEKIVNGIRLIDSPVAMVILTVKQSEIPKPAPEPANGTAAQ